MGLWSKIKDALAIYKKSGNLIGETGTVIDQTRLEGPKGDCVYETQIQTKSGKIIKISNPKYYGGLHTGNQVEVSYWNKVNSKGEVMDYEFNEATVI